MANKPYPRPIYCWPPEENEEQAQPKMASQQKPHLQAPFTNPHPTPTSKVLPRPTISYPTIHPNHLPPNIETSFSTPRPAPLPPYNHAPFNLPPKPYLAPEIYTAAAAQKPVLSKREMFKSYLQRMQLEKERYDAE
ncbi:MAG: hypothetical protein Q9195_006685, partial [Heterodermia aff. obscurata]